VVGEGIVNTLAIDFGNSKIAVALLDAGAVVDRLDIAWTKSPGDGAGDVARVYDWCADQLRLTKTPIDGLVCCSVVPALTEVWRHLWRGKQITQAIDMQVIDATTAFPFRVTIEGKDTVGADRYCNVAGAVAMGNRSALIVDVGTANTFDVLDDGVFIGGAIAPGCIVAHEAMVSRGARLPEVTFDVPGQVVGRNTVEAMQSGSFYQAVGGVRAVIEAIRGHYPHGPTFLTGGLAEVLAGPLDMELLYRPHLTLEGAASLRRPNSK